MKKDSVEYNGLLGGALVLAGLILYFFMMRLAGLDHNLSLRALNIFIMAGGVFFAITRVKSRNDDFDYLKGLGTGILAAASSSLAFAIFIFIYLKFVNTDFLLDLVDNEPFGIYLNPFKIAFIIIIEGFGSGLLLSFGFMQWHKRNTPRSIVEKDSNDEKTQ